MSRFEKGSSWVAPAVVEFMLAHPDVPVGCNNSGSTGVVVGAVLESMAAAGLPVSRLSLMNGGEFKQACGGLLVAVSEGRFERPARDQADLDRAVADATERPLMGGFAWAQRNVTVPISPLNAVTVARALLPVDAVADVVVLSGSLMR